MTNNSIFLIVLISTALTGCQIKKSQQNTLEYSIPVITGTVIKTNIRDGISLSGNVEGSKTVRLGFLVAGKIDFIAVNEGEKVLKGQLLASLDPASYTIAKELAEIQVNQVQDEYERLKIMHDRNSLSASDFAKISFGLQQVKAQLKLHAKNLSETKLYSPIDGVLLKKLAEAGEITGAGIPVIVVSDIHKIKANAYIPENELHKIKLGQTAEVTITSLDKIYEGKITEVSSLADPASRAFSLKIEVENPGMLIRPGMIAEVKILTGQNKEMLMIPVEALLHDFNGLNYIYSVDTVKMKAFRRNITTGKLINDHIEVLSGINQKEILVRGGQQKLVDGSPVSINK